MDASVVVTALLGRGGAGALARERLRSDTDVHVPCLLDVEVTSALRRLVRTGQGAETTASEALTDLTDLAATRWDHQPLLRRVWQLRDNISTYDACYVALAEILGTELVTSDARLARAPGLQCGVDLLTD